MAEPDRWERWAPFTGIVFVVLFFVLFLISPETPPGATAEELGEFYRQRGTAGAIADFALVGLGAAAFLWFAGSLRTALRRIEGEPGRLSSIAFAAGATSATLILVAGALFTAPLATVVFEEEQVALDPILDSLFGGAGFIALNFSLIASAVMFTAASLVGLRTRALPQWFVWLGFLVSLALLFNLAYFWGFFVWLAWVLVISIFLMVRTRPTAAVPPG